MEATVNGYSSLVELETKGHAIFEMVFGALNKFHELAVCKTNRLQDIHLVFTKETEENYEAIWLTSHLELLDADGNTNSSSAPTDSSSILLLDSHSADESVWKLYKNMAKLLDDSDETFPADEQLFYAITVASNSYSTEN